MNQEYLRSILDYDSETGVFTWRHRPIVELAWNRKWANKTAGGVNGDGYIQIKIDGKKFKAHRLVWLHVYGEWPAEQLDHINGQRTDNRLCNLRAASHVQNTYNRGPQSDNTSGYKGVSWKKKSRKWQAVITVNRCQKHLGYFESVEDAHAVYAEAARELHGEFARVM